MRILRPMQEGRLRPRGSLWVTVPWYPIAIVATYAINLWVDSGVSVMAVMRSLVVAVVGAGLFLCLLLLITRRLHVAGALTLIVILALLTRGLVYTLALLVLVVTATLAVRLWGRIRRRPITWPQITTALNVVSALLLAVVLAGGLIRGTLPSVTTDIQQGRSTLHDSPEVDGLDRPSIYVLMLDGYPRADSFTRLFGGNNNAFLAELRERGFVVAANSESNYMFTQLTLTSMFQMKPLSEIPALEPLADDATTAHLLMRQTLNDNPAFDILRSQGYRIVTSSPGFEHVALRQSDVYLDDGQLNEFEYQLLRFTTAQRIVNLVAPDFFADQHRDRIRSNFRHYAEVAASDGGPTFAFIHVPAPHLPVVFNEDGSDAYLPPSEDIFDWAEIDSVTRERYVRQLTYLNRRVSELVDHTTAGHSSGPEPVIIVMSDHGAAPRPAVFIGEGTDDHYANLFAARTPGAAELFGNVVSPVNVFPRLFNAYFGMELEEWPNARYDWAAAPKPTRFARLN